MKNVSFAKLIIPAVMAGLLAFGTTKSVAINEPFDASIEVLDQLPVLFTENQGLNFGKIVPPTSGSQVFTVDANSGLGSPKIPPGPNDGFIVSGEKRAEISIAGGPDVDFLAVTVLPVIGSCTLPGTNLFFLESKFASPASKLPINLNIGGSLNVLSGVSPGPGTCSYTIDVVFP